MNNLETPEKQKERFKAMSSDKGKALIREKMKAEGLVEGSGVLGKDLSSYDRDEIWELIQVISSSPGMQTKRSAMQLKSANKKKSLVTWILLAIILSGGMILYYEQYPSPGMRREISINGMFWD
mgnify:CR=1 FL=1